MMYYLPLQPARGCQRSYFSWHEHFDQGSARAREDMSDYGNEGGLGGIIEGIQRQIDAISVGSKCEIRHYCSEYFSRQV